MVRQGQGRTAILIIICIISNKLIFYKIKYARSFQQEHRALLHEIAAIFSKDLQVLLQLVWLVGYLVEVVSYDGYLVH